MFTYLLRTLPIYARDSRKIDGRITLERPDRVRLSDVGEAFHLKHAQFTAAMERARLSLLIRSGRGLRWQREGIEQFAADSQLVLRRQLMLGQRYRIDVRFTGVEGRLLVAEHLVLVGDRVHARGIVRLIFRDQGGVLSRERVLALTEGMVSPPRPVQDWRVS